MRTSRAMKIISSFGLASYSTSYCLIWFGHLDFSVRYNIIAFHSVAHCSVFDCPDSGQHRLLCKTNINVLPSEHGLIKRERRNRVENGFDHRTVFTHAKCRCARNKWNYVNRECRKMVFRAKKMAHQYGTNTEMRYRNRRSGKYLRNENAHERTLAR